MPSEDTQFKPGKSGNPNGSPMYYETYAELYKKFTGKTVAELGKILEDPTISAKYAIVIKDIFRALKGKDKPVERIQDRSDGKPLQRIEERKIDPEEELQRIKKVVNE